MAICVSRLVVFRAGSGSSLETVRTVFLAMSGLRVTRSASADWGMRKRFCAQNGRRRKSSGRLHVGKQMRFESIQGPWDVFPVSRLCEVLDVSPSGYYLWRRCLVNAREIAVYSFSTLVTLASFRLICPSVVGAREGASSQVLGAA